MLTKIQSDALAMCKSVEISIPKDCVADVAIKSIDMEAMSMEWQGYFDYFQFGISSAWANYQVVHAYELKCSNRSVSDVLHEEYDEEVCDRYDALCDLDDLTDEQQAELNDLEEKAYDCMWSDPHLMYDIDIDELAQIWIDCNTGDVVYLLKYDRALNEINSDYPFVILDETADAEEIKTIKNIIGINYVDFHVNDLLVARGYDSEGISIFPFSSEDNDEKCSGYANIHWVEFMQSALRGGQEERDMKQYTLQLLLFSYGIDNEDLRKAFLTACRICKRHKYSPYQHMNERYNYLGMYKEYIERLVYLGKDIHNPHYVCPPDFEVADREIRRQYSRKLERQRIIKEHEREMKRIAEDRIAFAEFEQRMAPFSDFRFFTPDFYIVPCTTIASMQHEGEVMHHCVYEQRYYKKSSCQIWLVRKPDGSPLSTIELNLNGWTIAQNRGKCNCVPEFYNESNALLMQNIEKIKAVTTIKTKAA